MLVGREREGFGAASAAGRRSGSKPVQVESHPNFLGLAWGLGLGFCSCALLVRVRARARARAWARNASGGRGKTCCCCWGPIPFSRSLVRSESSEPYVIHLTNLIPLFFFPLLAFRSVPPVARCETRETLLLESLREEPTGSRSPASPGTPRHPSATTCTSKEVLHAIAEIQDEDPTIARICHFCPA
jgi:hypothetical protein